MAIGQYTPYTIRGGRVVQVPNDKITDLQRNLKISRSEAVEVWLSDNIEGYEHPQIQELTDKASQNKISKGARADKPKTQRERVVKEDKVKETIVQAVADLLPSLNAENVVVEKKGKLITFTVGADKFKFDLVRHRPPKEGKG